MKGFFQIKKILMAAGILIISVIILSSCSQSEDVNPNTNGNNGQQTTNNNPGDAAPDFELNSLDGSTFKLSNHNDKVVVLFFFGNTCPSCRAVGPDIEKKLNEAFSAKSDFVIVGLDVWDGNSSSVNSFKSTTGITFPLLLKASSVAKSFSTTYDRLVVIDKKGNIAHNGSRAAANDVSEVVNVVNDLLDDM